ncbi:uncharacterized protein LOC143296296 [Babylonia areolata]|uniref:uncharacterized protein LOC143296296 n=1 Tax=Babylonia areolata TaxID=304850 RepID=UPI003FD65CFB
MYGNWQAMNQYAAAAAQATATNLYAQTQQAAQTGQTGMPMMGPGMGVDGSMQQQQQMYQWYYGNWQQQQQQPGMMQQGYGQQQYPPLPTEQMLNPAPPVEPPKDAKPPLPPEPPPEEPDKEDMKKPPPPLPSQTPWQPPPPADEPPKPPPPQPALTEDPALKSQMEGLMREEKEFVVQYDQWKQQYHDWQEQNKNHPNKEQFGKYLAQWKEYEQQMEERRKDIDSRKKALQDSMKRPSTSTAPPQGPPPPAGGRNQRPAGASAPPQGTPGGPQGSNPTPRAPGAPQLQGSRGPIPGGMMQQGVGGPNQQYPSGGFDSEVARQEQYRPLPVSSAPSGPGQGPSSGYQQRGSTAGLLPTPEGGPHQDPLPGTTAMPDTGERGEDDMDLDDTGQEDMNQGLQDFSRPPPFTGPQGNQDQEGNYRGPGPQNYGGHFQGGRGGPQGFRGGGPQNFRGGQNFQGGNFQGGNFQGGNFQGGPNYLGDRGWQGQEEDQCGQGGGGGGDRWQDQENWQGAPPFQGQRGGFRGRGGPPNQRGRGGGPDSMGGQGQGMGRGGFGGPDPYMGQDNSGDMGYSGPDSGPGRGRGGGGRYGEDSDMAMNQGDMGWSGRDSIGSGEMKRGGFRGRGMGPDGFRGRGGPPPFRGRGGFTDHGGNFGEDNFEDMEGEGNTDQFGQNQDFHDQPHRMGEPPPYHGMRGGRGGPGMGGRGGPAGMGGRGGPGQFSGRGGPAHRGRGGPWQQGPHRDDWGGQDCYGQEDCSQDQGFDNPDDYGGDGGYNQFSSRGRGGPPRGRGGPGFNAPRGGGMMGGPPDFPGPYDQRGRGRGLLGPGPPPRGRGRGGGPMPLMNMHFDEHTMEQRLAETEEVENDKEPEFGSESIEEKEPASSDITQKPVGVPQGKPLSGKDLGLGDKLPLSFGRGGGFEIEEDDQEEESEAQGWQMGRGHGRGRGRGRGRGGFHQQVDEEETEDFLADDGMVHEESGRGRSGAFDRGRGRGGAFGERGRGRGDHFNERGRGKGGFGERGRGRGRAYDEGGPEMGGAYGESGPEMGGAFEDSSWGGDRGYDERGRGRGRHFVEGGRGRGGPFGGFSQDRGEEYEDFEQGPDNLFGERGRGRGRPYSRGGPQGRGRGQYPGERDVEGGAERRPGPWGPEKDLEPMDPADPMGPHRPPRPEDWPPPRRDPLRDPADPYFDDPYRRPPFEPRAPVDPYDPYMRRPFGREYDPYLDRNPAPGERRLREDPYRDSYGRDPDPWARERPLPAEPEKRLFVPAESIDYGHASKAVPAANDTPKVKPEVIEYGHSSKTNDPLADLDREAQRFERDKADRLARLDWEDTSFRRAEDSGLGQPERETLKEDDRHDSDRRDSRGGRGELDTRGSGFPDDRGRRDDRSRFDLRPRDSHDRESIDRYRDRFGDRGDRPPYSDRLDHREEPGRSDPFRERGNPEDRGSPAAREDRVVRDFERVRDGRPDRYDRGGEHPGFGNGADRFDREPGHWERERTDRDRAERDRFGRDRPDTDQFNRGGRENLDRDRMVPPDRREREDVFDRDRDPFGRDRDRDRDRDSFRRERDSSGRDRESFGRERDALERERDPFGRDRDVHGRLERTERERDSFGRDQDQFGRDRDPVGRDRDVWGKDRDTFGRPDAPGRPDRGRPDIPERAGFPEREDRPLDFRSDSGPGPGPGPSDLRPREVDRLRDSDRGGSRDRSPRDFNQSPRDFHPPPSASASLEKAKVEDLICTPGRASRPPHLVVIVRGLPGSGKTYVSKLLREKEIANGGGAPRMLSLDDYFMVEVEKKEVDPDTGKKVTKKVLEYEYEQDMEEAYLQSLFKSFKKTVDDGLFPFIIVDAINEKVKSFEPFWSYAKSKGFQVYVAELEADVATCINRNIHKWTEYDVEKVKGRWEPTPPHFLRLDIRWLLQDASITEVEMEDAPEDEKTEANREEKRKREEEDDEEEDAGVYKKSRWELDTSEVKLDKLDGLAHGMHKSEKQSSTSMEDYLQLSDDYYKRKSTPGKKMVRWADLEEKKEQNRRRELGFVVGQTQKDWDRITDDTFAEKALNQTKYF